MKRLLTYLFLGLLFLVFCNTAFAGCIEGNCRNGQGMYTAEGDIYVGEFKNGELHGQGTYVGAGGDEYVGEFKNGELHGQGTYTYASGNKYVGEYKDGKIHGQGTYTHANGDKYVGEFKDAKRHGPGTYTWVDGRIDSGVWKKNKLVKRNKIQTQIAKKESTQTQQVVKATQIILSCVKKYNQ